MKAKAHLELQDKPSLEGFCVSGKGCRHCERRAALLQSEKTCPEAYRCPMCKAQWIFEPRVEMEIEDYLELLHDADSQPFACKCGKCKPEDFQYLGKVFVSAK